MAELYSAESWLLISNEEIENRLQNESWPFQNVTPAQFYELLKSIDLNLAPKTIRTYCSSISAVGIVFTILLIGAIWKKAISERNFFYIAMMFISVTDLIFNIFDLIMNLGYRTYKMTGSTNKFAMWFMLAIRGPIFSLSLTSDMLAVALTFERYLSIVKPQLHKILNEQYNKILRLLVTLTVFLLGFSRMHYSLVSTVEKVGPIYLYTSSEISNSSFIVGLSMFSDMILPFISLALMLILSTLFRNAVINIKKKKMQRRAQTNGNGNGTVLVEGSPQTTAPTMLANPPKNNHVKSIKGQVAPVEAAEMQILDANTIQNLKSGQSSLSDQQSILALTLSMDGLFLFNQLGYCAFSVAELLVAKYYVFYEISYDQLESWIIAQRFYTWSIIVSAIAEHLSHSLNFPLYMIFSKSMKAEFRAFVKRIGR